MVAAARSCGAAWTRKRWRRPSGRPLRATEGHVGVGVVVGAGAGGAAHLAGMAASMTHLPVIAVPVASNQLKGMDSLLSMVQMPKGVAVACQAIGEAGAFNAGLMAAQILATSDPELSEAIQNWRAQQTDNVPHAVD